MNLIYSCVFFQESYVQLLELLLKSYKLFGNNTTYLILTSQQYYQQIKNIMLELEIEHGIWTMNVTTIFESAYSRLLIFNYPHINKFSKILYLDVDILITGNLNKLFEEQLEDKIYCLKEGNTKHPYWGHQFFENNPECRAFSTGIILFNNCDNVKQLFANTLKHINYHLQKNRDIPRCLEQPFLIFNAFQLNLYNNELLGNYAKIDPKEYDGLLLYHFAGNPGHFKSKIEKMTDFLQNQDFSILKKISENNYKEILQKNKHMFDKLTSICKEIGEQLEGNCFTEHLNINNQIDELIFKQMNHFSLAQKFHKIMEIGFNAGHSTLLYLLAHPENTVTAFDLCEHKYTIPCFKYICSLFPNRLKLYAGDSTIIVPKFINLYPNEKFDLIHIDGCHLPHIAKKDFDNCLKLANGLIIFDDTQIPVLNNLFDYYLQNEQLIEIKNLYNTLIYKHRIAAINPILNKKFSWGNSTITFTHNGGKYTYLQPNIISTEFGQRTHLIHFNNGKFISLRKDDFEIVKGYEINIPKIIFQTSKNPPNLQIVEKIKSFCPDWQYFHFSDENILQFFKDFPLEQFPNIAQKFNEFSKGQHKADLFRYYYLYINGGVFMDSDAIMETNISNILKNYSAVFVKSFMPKDYIFNGFIATYPQNPIIYEALKHAYNTNNQSLEQNYHYLCEQLWAIYNNINHPNTKLYQEVNMTQSGYGGSIIVDDNNEVIISHYWQSKKIPNITSWNNYNKNETSNFDFHTLTLFNCNNLIRIGPNSDGGYIIADGLQYDAFISCGIGNDIRFEEDFLKKYPNLKCFAFDGTIVQFPQHNSNIEWINKNISSYNSQSTTNLSNYLTGNNIFLKMDIEGSEFNWIDYCTTEQLKKFSQIVIEIHWPFDNYRCNLLKKLAETHYLIHVHGNNYNAKNIPSHLPCGRSDSGFITINKIDFPEVFEATYIRKDLLPNAQKITKQFPTHLDKPNNQYYDDLHFVL